MKSFDLIYEQMLTSLREEAEPSNEFRDNISALVKTLLDNDFLSAKRNAEVYINDILAQPTNVKEILLDTKEQSLPAIKLKVKQPTDPSSFAVTVVELEHPDRQKEFSNTMLETIFEDVLNHIKNISLKGLSPDSAVEQLPQTDGGPSQPGAETSALPTGPQ